MSPALNPDPIQQLHNLLPGAPSARTLVIAGSGLGGFVKAVQVAATVSFGDIPGVGESTVAGHSGQLVFGHVGPHKTPALVMSGRRHLYEGLDPAEAVRLPRLILDAWPNIKHIIVSNAAGGLNPAFAVGDLMLITNHINWMFRSPLRGPTASPHQCDPRHSPVFDPDLRQLALQAALKLHIPLRQGTYLAMMGPSYETRAEVLMARHLLGADAVGMSTVPESIMAASLSRKVLGISFISNMLVDPAPLTHHEVVQNSILVEEKFSRLIADLLHKIHTP